MKSTHCKIQGGDIMLCDLTLYKILVKSNNPRLSYSDLNITNLGASTP